MDNKHWMNYESVQEDLELELSAIFPSALLFPQWPYESEMKEDHLLGTLMEGGFYSNTSYLDPFQGEFATLLDDTIGYWDDTVMEVSKITEEDMKIVQQHNTKKSTMSNKREREDRVLNFEEVSQFFNMPIIQAAKELNVGLTLLKKKCRELGIPRWPHRRIKSMQTLINNVKELGWKEGSVGDTKVKIEDLELEQKLMVMRPSIQMNEKTRKIRQACFKANYKKRRLVAGKDEICRLLPK